MKIIKSLSIGLLCFALFPLNGNAQTGCFTAGGNKDLYTMTGTTTTTNVCGTGTLSYSGVQTKYSKPSGCSWVPLSTSGTCKVNAPEGSNLCGIIGLYTLSCPIDDYIPYLILLLTGLGFITLRNNRSVYFNIF